MEVITTHKNADFDALAAVFAAQVLYPLAIPVLPTTLNPNVRAFLSFHKDLFSFHTPKEVSLDKSTRLIIVDTNSWSRLEGMDGLPDRSDLEIHIWDHHPDPGDINANWSCLELAGAATTLLVKRFEEEGTEISPIQATLFLAGIYEDTGNLTFPSTTAADARSAGFLLEQEADLEIIKSFLRPAYGPKQKEILFEMLRNAGRMKVNGYTVSLGRLDISGHTPGLSLVVDMYLDILNVDAAFGIFRDAKRDRCIVIGRSVGDSLNIGHITRGMGGGGHVNAGSAMLKSVNPDAMEEWITELIKGNNLASVQISDLMSFPVTTVSPETPMKEVALLLREKGSTGFPVVDGSKVAGIISRRDFKKMRKPPHLTSPARAFMSTRVIDVSPEKSVVEAARLMVKNDIGRLPVVEKGELIGIITRSDAMRYYYDLMPD